MLWDIYKSWRTNVRSDKALLDAIRLEIGENAFVAQENVITLNAELEALDQGQTVVNPLVPYKIGMWEVLRVSIPSKVVSNVELFSLLRHISYASAHLNESFRSRQTYKDTYMSPTGDMYAFVRRMKVLNAELRRQVKGLQELLAKAATQLGN